MSASKTNNMSLFKTIKVERNNEYSKSYKETKFQFLIPGVNSGAYTPTLHVQALIKELPAIFF